MDELKASILEILQTYHHESNILAGCASLLKGDISENVADVYNVAVHLKIGFIKKITPQFLVRRNKKRISHVE